MRERKNNIVIKGVRWQTKSLEQEITDYIKDIEVEIEIKRANKIKLRDYNSRNKQMAAEE